MHTDRRTLLWRAPHLASWGAPLALLLAFAALLAAPRPALAAGTINVTTTAEENGAGAGCSLREAFRSADDNLNFGGCTGSGGGAPFTINVPAGTYTLTVDELKIGDATNTNTSIVGAGAASTIIQQTVANRRVIDVNSLLAPNVSVSISGVTITGGNSPSDNFHGAGIIGGGPGNTLSLSNCTITGNTDTSGSAPKGGGVEFAGGGVLNINNCTISNNTVGTSASNLGVGGGVDYQLLNNPGAAGQGGLSITNTTFSNNVAGAANSGAGGAVHVAATTTQAPSGLTISNNTFTGNQANASSNGLGGAIANASSNPVTIQFNRFFNNTATGGATGVYKVVGSGSSTNATENWWGCNAGPGNAGCDSIGGETANITAAPRLVLSHTPAASALLLNGATTLTASFLADSAGAAVSTANLSRLIGQPITFNNPTRGALSSIQTTIQANGTATATFTAGNTSAACGAGGANAVFDNQALPAALTVQCADLTATTANSVSGSVVTGQGWTWTTTVANPGNAAASYSAGQTVFSANLPNSAGISYGSPASSNPSIGCSINSSNDLICTASSAVSIAPAASFTIAFSAVASAAGSYAAPRAGGACSVDPGNLVVESNEANNACSNTVTVNKANTTTTITSDTPDPSVTGQPVAVSYSVAVSAPGAGTPTGNVTVSDGTSSCTGTVGAGTCNITFTSPGAKSLTATYAGDTNFNGSTSAAATHAVNKADTTTTITSDTPDPSATGQAVTVNFSMAANTPGAGTLTGNVTVSDGVDSCTAAVSAGTCSITLTTAGARSLTATYAGDANFNGSISAGEPHTVSIPDTTPPNVTINQASGQPDPTSASPIRFTAVFNEPVTGFATGDVTLSGTAGATTAVVTQIAPNDGTTYDIAVSGMTTSGTVIATIPAGVAQDAAGNPNNASTSTDNTVTFISIAANPDTTTTITSDTPDPSVVGQAVTVQYSVVPNTGSSTPTGNVTVSDGTVACTASVTAGQCSLTFTSAGAKALTATYAGDGTFNGSTSAGEPHAVNKADTTTTITSDAPDPSTVNQPVIVQYQVSVNSPGAGTPTGNVTVSDGTASCTASVAAGQCSLTFTSAGPKSLTATYAGDDNFNGSTSAGEPHIVNLPLIVNMTVAKSHSGNFTQGQSGAQYTIVASNGGSAPSSGTVTVADTLPAGLTATAIGGSGWNCVLATLTCTRSDALAPSSSYPSILVTVDVAANAPASVTNSATISGGGDANPADNTASDPTTINPAGGGSGAQLVADPCFAGKSALLVSGTAGNDTIKLSAASGGRVTVTINGANLGTFKPTGLLIVIGQAGNDAISVADAILQPRILYGGDGNDTIKDGFGLGVVIGGAGDDTITSKTSRDILIGGAGADKLTGSLVDDILIAGSTSYDDPTAANQAALCSIYAEWSNLTRSYQTRIDHLTGAAGSGLNGSNLLKPGQTVFDDASKDTLTGATGQDWFLLNKAGAGTLDTSDRRGSEIATDL